MKRVLFWISVGVLTAGVVTYVLNETPFLYSEPVSPGAFQTGSRGSILIDRPKKDCLVLFIHGFKSTPHDFERAASALSGRYNACAILLPGHGASSADFERSYFSHWYAYVRHIYLMYRRNYAHVFVCGHSMGGTLALKLGEEFNHDLAPDGIVAISAPVFFNQLAGLGVLQDWRLYFSRYISWAAADFVENRSAVDEDGADWVGYRGRIFPIQTHSLKLGLISVKSELPRITAPLLLMHARNDATVPYANLCYIAKRVSSSSLHIRTFRLPGAKHSRHLLTLYRTTRDAVIDELRCFIEQTLAGK
jgi:carboxylesterase